MQSISVEQVLAYNKQRTAPSQHHGYITCKHSIDQDSDFKFSVYYAVLCQHYLFLFNNKESSCYCEILNLKFRIRERQDSSSTEWPHWAKQQLELTRRGWATWQFGISDDWLQPLDATPASASGSSEQLEEKDEQLVQLLQRISGRRLPAQTYGLDKARLQEAQQRISSATAASRAKPPTASKPKPKLAASRWPPAGVGEASATATTSAKASEFVGVATRAARMSPVQRDSMRDLTDKNNSLPTRGQPSTPPRDSPASKDATLPSKKELPFPPPRELPPKKDSPALPPKKDSPALPPRDSLSLPPKDSSSLPRKDSPSLPPRDSPSLPPKDSPSLPPKDSPSLPPKRDSPSLPPKDSPLIPPKRDSPSLPPKDSPLLPPKKDSPSLCPKDSHSLPSKGSPSLPPKDSHSLPKDYPPLPPRDSPSSADRELPLPPRDLSSNAERDLPLPPRDSPAERELPLPPKDSQADREPPLPPRDSPANRELPVPPRDSPADRELPLPPRDSPADRELPLPPRDSPADRELPLPPRDSPADRELPLPPRDSPADRELPLPPRDFGHRQNSQIESSIGSTEGNVSPSCSFSDSDLKELLFSDAPADAVCSYFCHGYYTRKDLSQAKKEMKKARDPGTYMLRGFSTHQAGQEKVLCIRYDNVYKFPVLVLGNDQYQINNTMNEIVHTSMEALLFHHHIFPVQVAQNVPHQLILRKPYDLKENSLASCLTAAFSACLWKLGNKGLCAEIMRNSEDGTYALRLDERGNMVLCVSYNAQIFKFRIDHTPNQCHFAHLENGPHFPNLEQLLLHYHQHVITSNSRNNNSPAFSHKLVLPFQLSARCQHELDFQLLIPDTVFFTGPEAAAESRVARARPDQGNFLVRRDPQQPNGQFIVARDDCGTLHTFRISELATDLAHRPKKILVLDDRPELTADRLEKMVQFLTVTERFLMSNMCRLVLPEQ